MRRSEQRLWYALGLHLRLRHKHFMLLTHPRSHRQKRRPCTQQPPRRRNCLALPHLQILHGKRKRVRKVLIHSVSRKRSPKPILAPRRIGVKPKLWLARNGGGTTMARMLLCLKSKERPLHTSGNDVGNTELEQGQRPSSRHDFFALMYFLSRLLISGSTYKARLRIKRTW